MLISGSAKWSLSSPSLDCFFIYCCREEGSFDFPISVVDDDVVDDDEIAYFNVR